VLFVDSAPVTANNANAREWGTAVPTFILHSCGFVLFVDSLYLTYPHPGPPLLSAGGGGKGRVWEGLGEVKYPNAGV